jgi:hypothetical protein
MKIEIDLELLEEIGLNPNEYIFGLNVLNIFSL